MRKGFSVVIMAVLVVLLLLPAVSRADPTASATGGRERAGDRAGWTWYTATVDSTGNVGEYTSLALASDGRIRVSYYGSSDLKYAYFDGTSWSTQIVDSAGDVGLYTSLVYDGIHGQLYISYYDATNGDLKCAQGPATFSVDTSGDVGRYTSAVLTAAGWPAIAYYDVSNGDLKYAAHDGMGWTSETVDSGGDTGRYTSLQMQEAGPYAGWPAIAYYDVSSGDLRYAAAGVEPGQQGAGNPAGYWRIETVDSAGDAGQWASLDYDSLGRPHIIYMQNGYQLNHAYRDGLGWQFDYVDTSVQGNCALAIGPDDALHVSYRKADGLHYATYVGVGSGDNCGAGWQCQLVEAGDVGYYSDIAVDDQNRPHISYRDGTGMDLKHAHACVWASFSASPIPQCVYQPVQFTNTTLGVPPITYEWDFGDGGTSTLPSPSHSYSQGGGYTVWMTATAGCGYDVFSASVVISSTPEAGYTYGPLPVCVGATTQFTNTTAGSPTLSFIWDFGDGLPSTDPNPTHTFTLPDTYTVALVASNGCGLDVFSSPVQAHGQPTGSTLSWQPEPVVGETVTFTAAASSTLPLSFAWDFGDGGTGTGRVTTHVYHAPGTYIVALTAENSCGEEVVAASLDVCAPAAGAGFTFTPADPVRGQTIAFSGQVTGTTPYSFTWALGDGVTATGAVVTHAYADSGDYLVTMTVTNPCGVDAAAHVVHVCGPAENAWFAWSPDPPPLEQTITLTAHVSGTAPLTHTWDFGDGQQGTGPVVHHAWSSMGQPTRTVTITLAVENPCGADQVAMPVTLVSRPAAAFSCNTPVCWGAPTVFTNTSQGAEPLSYLWTLGDGITSTLESPVHTYTVAAVFTVTLRATNPYGVDQVSHPAQVVAAVSAAAFSWEPQLPPPGAAVTFTAAASGSAPISYTWAFGDGGAGAGPAVTHTYAVSGTYHVTLHAANPCGGQTAAEDVEVAHCASPAGLALTHAPLYAGQLATLTATVSAGSAPLTYGWDLGDGSPWLYGPAVVTHTYAAAGPYTVSVAVWNSCGTAGPQAFPVQVSTAIHRIHLPIVLRGFYSGDGYEPDGAPALARLLSLGSPQRHDFAPEGDVDWVYVNIASSATYLLRTLNLSGGADTRIYLYDASGGLVASNDDCPGGLPPDNLASCISAVLAPGRYHLRLDQSPLAPGGPRWGPQVQYTVEVAQP